MSERTWLKAALIVAGLCAAPVIGTISAMAPPALAANAPKPAVSEEVRAALAQMGKTLLADQFSFQARTLRVYVERNGQPLHIAHTIQVVVRRPDRLSINISGDDGSTRLYYDGKTVTLLGV